MVRLEIFHLFLHVTVIFYDNECSRLNNLRCILVWLEVVYGLRVNLSLKKPLEACLGAAWHKSTRSVPQKG